MHIRILLFVTLKYACFQKLVDFKKILVLEIPFFFVWNCGGLTGAAYRFGLEQDCLESFARRARGYRNREPGTRNRVADRLDWSRACSYVGVRTGTRNTSADSRCMWLSRSRNPLGVARYCSIRLRFELARAIQKSGFKGKISHSWKWNENFKSSLKLWERKIFLFSFCQSERNISLEIASNCFSQKVIAILFFLY